jgi:dTDP-4-dehydrorhamnose reductase
MLGHKMFQRLRERFPNTCCTVRSSAGEAAALAPGLLDRNVIADVDAMDWSSLDGLLCELKPSVIVNCVGIVKQRAEAKEAIPSIIINSLLPHRLAGWCERWSARLIHFSTDCVFSGERGNYSEEDHSDAKDVYGKTKFLGEVAGRKALTLRTSMIGRELTQFASLLEWFLSQGRGPVKGYTRAFYSGVTTNYLAELVARIIEEKPELHGLYQVTAPTISKFELLGLLRDAYQKDVEVVADDSFFCDRSMKGDKFVADTGYRCPPWAELIAQLAQDKTPYERWRRHAHETV